MVNFVKSIIFIALSILIAMVTNYIIDWLSPHYITLGWIWLLLIFFFIGGILVAIIGFIPKLLSAAIVSLRSFSALESLIVTIILVVYTFISCSKIWNIYPLEYSFRQVCASISLNIMTIQIYLALFRTLVQYKKI